MPAAAASHRTAPAASPSAQLPAVAQAILEQLDRPLLCSTAGGGGEGEGAADAATLMDRYGPLGLDFVVDAGPRTGGDTTVVDCTGAAPVVRREGAGDAAWLEDFE